ncbi:hypothetical protein F0562_022253 [Nyssa sinensis]|uniref:GAT domain-containing protein n=1 Tax=Nyssa sinensis TaxID=561372 RepID=A0A5J5BSP4_9ASTE|nr:hypothetical protein F0562_022253 [Nyssa sinensis]
MTHPMAVTNGNIDMESLISDQNRSIATLAITTLLKTGNESSVDRLMKQITNFMSDIVDEFKIVVDDLTTTLVKQCHQSQFTMQRIIETVRDNEALLFEALHVNDEIQKVLVKYEDLNKLSLVPLEPEPAMIPIAVEPDDSPPVKKEDALVKGTIEESIYKLNKSRNTSLFISGNTRNQDQPVLPLKDVESLFTPSTIPESGEKPTGSLMHLPPSVAADLAAERRRIERT